MRNIAERVGIGAVRLAMRAKEKLRENETLRRLYYSAVNAQAFEDVFWHDVMLADRVRIETYARAIQKHIHRGMVVIDVGTGSGILACLAAKTGARVIAIEHTHMIEQAKRVAASNGLTNIDFLSVHSRDLRLKEQVDVILHEQIGNYLVDENMVENLTDLRDRILRPGGQVLPGMFELYVDPVEVDSTKNIPFCWEQDIEGIRFDAMRAYSSETGTAYDKRFFEPDDVKAKLTEPQRLTCIDLNTMSSTGLVQHAEYSAPVIKSGNIDGFCMYFRVLFDEEINFSTGPGNPRTHWASRLLRTPQTSVREGQTVRFSIQMSPATNPQRWKWEWSVK